MRSSIHALRVVLGVMLAVGMLSSCQRIEGTQVGVVTCNFHLPLVCGLRGVSQDTKGPGTHLYIPFVMEFDVFTKTQITLPLGGSGHTKHESDLRLKTSDGNDVRVDGVVVYQVVSDEAYKLVTNIGRDDATVARLVRAVFRSIIRSKFGELNTSQFYAGAGGEAGQEAMAWRKKKANETRDEMSARLSMFGLSIISVDILGDRFTDDYQAAIEAKKLADQEAEKNKALIERAKSETQTEIARLKGEARAMVAEAEVRAEKVKVRANAEKKAKLLEADGVLAERVAEARGVQAVTKALDGPGGTNLVAHKVAESLKGKRILLIPSGGNGQVRVLDLNKFLHDYTAFRVLTDSKAPQAKATGAVPAEEVPPSNPSASEKTN